jgi:MoxR-like ATPase
MKMIVAAWLSSRGSIPLAPLLVGEPGVGKNRLIYELAKRTNRKLYIFQGHEDVTAEDLACSVRFSDTEHGKMDYVASPLVTAMHEGGICFIDEIGKIRPRALALLVSVLDERRYIDSTLLGERVFARSGFRFIAATNTGEIQFLPEFIQSRMRPVIKVGYPPQEEINKIVGAQPNVQGQQHLEVLLNKFWELWEDANRKTDATKIKPPSPRDAIYLFALASSLSDYEFQQSTGLDKTNAIYDIDPQNFTSEISEKMLKVAFDELFDQEKE